MNQKLLLSKSARMSIGIALALYLVLSIFMNWTLSGSIFPRSFFSIFHRSISQKSPLSSPHVVSSPVPQSEPEGEFYQTFFAPKGDYFVTLNAVKQEDGTYLIALSGYGWGERRYMEPNGMQTAMWQAKVDEVTAKAYRYGNSLTWSSSGYKVALVTHTNVVEVWQFEEEVVSKFENSLVVKTHTSYLLPGAGYTLVFFDKNQMYLEHHEKGELYMLFPKLRRITNIEKQYGKQSDGTSVRPTLFSLPTNDGIGFGGDKTISLWRNGKVISYPLDASDLPDGYFQAMISPNLERICVVSQSSGYRGYSVFRLEGGGFRRAGARGMQYSDCKEWIDNNHVVVEESAYPSQYFYQYFLLDVRTGEKTFLSRYHRSEL